MIELVKILVHLVTKGTLRPEWGRSGQLYLRLYLRGAAGNSVPSASCEEQETRSRRNGCRYGSYNGGSLPDECVCFCFRLTARLSECRSRLSSRWDLRCIPLLTACLGFVALIIVPFNLFKYTLTSVIVILYLQEDPRSPEGRLRNTEFVWRYGDWIRSSITLFL